MSNRFYPRLAAQNLQKNSRFYLPYLFTVMGASAAFYMLLTTVDPRGIQSLKTGEFGALSAILEIGIVVVALVSGAFLLYTNSFLMKQRGRELGLYSILGMSRKNLTHMLFWETVYTALLGIGGGLIAGAVFDRLLLMLLGRIVGVGIPETLIYGGCLWKTAALFAVMLLVIFFINSGRVGFSRTAELLRSGSAGEREPKARWLLALLGAACLGGGYYIAITTQSVLQAITLFFAAVLLVIAGTFLLFLAGSVAILKLLRRRKRYYYQTRHFIAVSGLMYRMKRNAAGLAIICILSTAVLVMLSSTVSLYTGIEDLVSASYPRQVMTYVSSYDPELWQPDAEAALDYVREQGYHPENVQIYRCLGTAGLRTETGYSCDREVSITAWESTEMVDMLYILPAEDYAAVTGQAAALRDGQALVRSRSGLGQTFDVFGKTLSVVGEVAAGEITDRFESVYSIYGVTVLVVTEADFQTLYALQAEGYGDYQSYVEVNLNYDLPADEDAAASLAAVREGYALYDRDCATSFDTQDGVAESYRLLFGGLLYLGLFLGVLFLAGTVLIIYYKQLSEGYEDQDRFEILQNVGMSHREISGAIKSQMLLVFFLPLGTAVLHMAAACPIIVRVLRGFNFTNLGLFLGCVGVCVAVFAAIYAVVYAVTARTYYRIVSR